MGWCGRRTIGLKIGISDNNRTDREIKMCESGSIVEGEFVVRYWVVWGNGLGPARPITGKPGALSDGRGVDESDAGRNTEEWDDTVGAAGDRKLRWCGGATWVVPHCKDVARGGAPASGWFAVLGGQRMENSR